MTWAKDDQKLERVRALMGEHDLDALVVRAPDNVLYLTNFWGMKGYDACVFPRDGEPVLITIEASAEDAEKAWTKDVRFIKGYAPDDPRPVPGRTLDAALAASRDYATVGLELSMGTQAADRMVGEPTTFTKAWFDAWPDARDGMAVLNPARAIKTPQEIERVRLANEICAAAMEHVRRELRPGMTEAQAAAIWQSYVHGEQHENVELAFGFSLVWSGSGIKTFTATGQRPIQYDQPTLFEIWVVADGYWADHTKLLVPGELRADYREYEQQLLDVYNRAIDYCKPGASLAGLDVLMRDGLTDAGYPDQPTHPVCHGVGVRAHEPPYAHRAGGGTIEENMVLAIEPGAYWEGGGGLRVEDNFLITANGAEKLSPFPDGVVSCAT
ncbi:MAG TPA: Xaa-Pro peptidase family protein [Gaiellaceae bacterium]|nr:Xaa-Pro peptidase family protein [Gaiellaceae bacterium]